MSDETKKSKWMSNGCLRSAPKGAVDASKGIIEGVSVCTVGEAKGHGVHLDSEFIETVSEFGNEKSHGLKARFGHPNMCSTALGTFIGRFKNFSVDGDQVRADLFLSNSAKETPNGDLHAYVLNMADENPDMFGTSIVFSPGDSYKRDRNGNKVVVDGWSGKPIDPDAEYDAPLSDNIFVECDALHACDTVDEPAANDGGLFSKFANETVAGQLTEFLDLNPEIWDAFESNPDILKSLSEHGDKMDEFMDRYREYREHNGGHSMSDKPEGADALEEPEVPETPETPETPENLETEDAPDAPEGEDAPEGDDAPEVPEEGSDEPEDAPEVPEEGADEPESELSREDFLRIDEEFGSDIAAKTVRDGGDYVSALRTSHDALKDENKVLREKIAAFETKTDGGTPAVVTEATKKAALFNTGK